MKTVSSNFVRRGITSFVLLLNVIASYAYTGTHATMNIKCIDVTQNKITFDVTVVNDGTDQLAYKIFGFGTQLSSNIYPTTNPPGTISCSTGSSTVTGTGTSFTALGVGGKLYHPGGTIIIGTIQSITNNTTLTLTSNAGTILTNSGFRYSTLIVSYDGLTDFPNALVSPSASTLLNPAPSTIRHAENATGYPNVGVAPVLNSLTEYRIGRFSFTNTIGTFTGGQYVAFIHNLPNLWSGSVYVNGAAFTTGIAPNLGTLAIGDLRTGTITSSTLSTTVTGVGTAFLSELTAGNAIYKTDGTYIGTVQSISSNISLTLTANAEVNTINEPFNYFNISCQVPPCNLAYLNPTLTNPLCIGQTGSITANPTLGTPPYNYLWTPGGATTQTISATPGILYSVLITDATNCSVTSNNNSVTAPDTLKSTSITSNVTCPGTNTGSVNITVTGGTPPYDVTLGLATNQINTSGGSTIFSNLADGSYTYTVQDANGCPNSTFSFTIGTTPDNTNPIITCPNDTTINCDATNPNTGTATATDNCDPNPTISHTDVTINQICTNKYTINRTWKAQDASGNSSICVQAIIVTDTIAPVFTLCPAGGDLGCNPSGVPDASTATATDNCSNPTFSNTLGAVVINGCNRSRIRTYTAIDDCGNTSTCTQTFTWTEATAPVLAGVPADADLGCNPATPSCSAGVTASNECGSVAVTCTPGAITNVGSCGRSQTFTYSATACGLSSSGTTTYTWTVATAPALAGVPADADLGCNPAAPSCNAGVTASNECGSVAVTCTPGAITNVGSCGRSQTFTYTAIACGLTSSSTTTYTWTVATAPVLAGVPANADLGCNPAAPSCSAGVTASNECGSVAVTCTPGAITNVGSCGRSQTFTYSATACGLSSSGTTTYTWTVATAPVLAGVPADADLGCNPAAPSCSAGVTASNECGSVAVTCTPGAITNVGSCGRSQTFTYSATACGLSSSGTTTYTWTVATAPVLAGVPADADLGCNPAAPSCNAGVTSSNECGSVAVTCTPGAITNVGSCGRSQTFTYSATSCGLSSSGTTTYTWTVATAPVLAGVPADADLGCNPASLPACNAGVTASNECGSVAVTCTAGGISNVGSCGRSQTFTYSATACGLSSSGTTTYSWTVATAPVLAGVPADADLGCNPAAPSCNAGVTASNECGSVAVTCTPGAITNVGSCGRSQTFTYTAIACGLTSSSTTTYTWTVATAPVLAGVPADADLGCNPATPSCNAGVTASNECGSVAVTCTPGAISNVGSCGRSQTFTYSATACGLSSSGTTTYTWTVATAPVLAGVPADADLGCNPAAPSCSAGVTASNECGSVAVTCTPGTITNVGSCGRSQTFTYTAIACGLTSSSTTTYTWTVATAPVLAGVPANADLGCNPAAPSCSAGVTASNECGSVAVTCTPGAITNVGSCGRSQTFTYSATACGLSSSGTTTYTWTVATAPVLAGVPADADLGCNPAAPSCNAGVTASNECGSVAVTCTPGAITNVGSCGRSQTFTYSATACGLSSSGTTTYTWTVATAPVLAGVPADADLGCNPAAPSCNAGVTASNECGSVAVTCTPGAITNVGSCGRSQTFTYSATACGLSSSGTTTYTWTVATAPVLAGVPADADLGCNPAAPSCNAGVTASNECGSVAVTCTPGAITNVGSCGRSQTFTYSATACGLSSSGTTTYTWTVATAPVLAGVPADADLGCNPAAPSCNASVTASNECGSVAVTCTPGAISNVGSCGRSQTFTYSATACGLTSNSPVTYTWSVATAPVLAGVPTGSNLGCNPTTLPSCNESVTASNECGPIEVLCSQGAITTVGSCGRSQTFTYSATACGLTSTSPITYTWTEDHTAPVISNCAPDLFVFVNHVGCTNQLSDYRSLVSASDVCGSITKTQSPPPATTFLSVGPHTVTITVTDGCNNSTSCDFTVTVLPSTLALSATVHQILCFNGTGSVTLTPSGGTGSYTYSGDATTGLGEGTYNYTVTDANGCTATASATINAEPDMLELFATATQPLCSNQAGSVSLSASGGTGAYTFTGPNTTGLGVGNYTYTVTDANNCHATATVHINAAPAQLDIHTSIVHPTACTPGSVALSASGGTGAYTFSGDATTGLSAGTYTYTVEDANHCTASTSVTLNTAPSGLSLTATPNHPNCNGELGSVTLAVNGGVSPYTYTGAATTNLTAGTYAYTVSDGNGCTATATATVNAAPTAIVFTATATQIGCAGGNTGSIALSASGGTPNYTYSPTTTTGLGAGTYVYTVTDSKGCTKTASATINPALAPVVLTATATQPSACVAGSVALTGSGGSGGYTYSGPATTGLGQGTYTYTVADSRGCTATATATINAAPAALNLTATANQILCNGGTGSVTLSASGGTPSYTYSPTTTTGLGAGTYTFTVTDSKGCTKTATATINAAPTAIVFTATATQIACAGGKGSVALSATGGTGAYTYSPVTTTNLSAGTYVYTVTDQNGCTKTASATINAAPTAVSGTATVVNNVCNQSNGSITVTGSGGTPAYTYSLGATTNSTGSFTGLTNGTYTVTVTDSRGCTGTVNATLTCTGSVNCTITASATTVCSGSSVTLCAPVVPVTTCTKQTETFPNTYNTGFSRNLAGSFTGSTGSWATSSNGGATLVVTTPYYNPSTSYAIKFVNWRTDGVKPDGNSLAYTGIGTATATSPTSNLTTGVCYAPLLTMNFTLWTYSCNASDNTTTLALEFSSNGGSTWTSVWSKTSAQIYNTWGASNKTNIAVPIAASYQTATFKYRFKTNKPSGSPYNFYQFIDDVSITSPSACPNTYLWSPGGATTSCITVSPSSNTTYSVAVTNCSGTGTCSQVITVGTTPSCTITGYLSYCTGGSTSLCAPAGSGLTYAWSTGATSQCISVNSAGTRSVTVRNSSGCSSTCSVTVKAPLSISCNGESPSCSNGFLGSASVSIASNTGLSPYTYRWNTGATTSSISGLVAGTYTITVTDARGCTATCSKTLSNSISNSDYTTIASNFNNTSIASGRYIWFSAVVKVTNSGTYPCTIRFINQNISSSKFNLSPSNCKLVLTNSVSTSTTVWTGTEWLTTAPPNLSNNFYFISGMTFQTTQTISGNLSPVTWKGIFTTDCPGVDVCWKWSAAVYSSSFGTSYSAYGVKPIDKPTGSAYLNSDLAGTPENKKSFVIAGARGGGSPNYTGSFTGTTCDDACAPSICGQNPSVEVVVRTSNGGQTIENGNVTVSAYPNPFSSTTTIEFQRSDKTCHTIVQVYSLSGELVSTLFDSETEAGEKYSTEFHAEDLADAIYIYKIVSGDQLIIGKLILQK